jgi:Domain of unknown function (DUF4386)
MTNPNSLARIAGWLYLLVAVLGGFSELYVRSSLTVPGDAAATAQNVAEHAALFRVGFATDLVAFVAFLGAGLALYVILKPVNAGAALAMLVLNAVSVGIQAFNMLNHRGRCWSQPTRVSPRASVRRLLRVSCCCCSSSTGTGI